MIKVNQRYLNRLAASLFNDEAERQSFAEAILAGSSARPAAVYLSGRPDKKGEYFPFASLAEEWKNLGTTDQHQRGEIYLLDNSSLFACAPLCVVSLEAPSLLDVCAAPGGKSIVAWKQLGPRFLVANEVINKRVPILISNLKRCRINPCGISAFDSAMLAKRWPGVFDVVLVDAPCSGQSMLAKGDSSPGALNPAVINTNSNRQKRILANAAGTVAPGGYILYSTCTFSIEENEKVISWFQSKFPEFSAIKISQVERFQSQLTDTPCYRLFPQQGLGAGGFTALLRNESSGEPNPVVLQDERLIWRQDSF